MAKWNIGVTASLAAAMMIGMTGCGLSANEPLLPLTAGTIAPTTVTKGVKKLLIDSESLIRKAGDRGALAASAIKGTELGGQTGQTTINTIVSRAQSIQDDIDAEKAKQEAAEKAAALKAATSKQVSYESSAEVAASDNATQVVAIVNANRQAVGLAPLAMDSALMSAAETRISEICIYKSHVRPNGQMGWDMVKAAGFSYYGENMVWGQPTPANAMNWWMNSYVHRKNIMGAQYTSIGVACRQGSDGRMYWVELFGG